MDIDWLQEFSWRLTEYCRHQLWAERDNDLNHALAHPGSVHIKDGRIYCHATARFNFTTYNVQRDQDVIHASQDLCGFAHDKSAILVHTTSSHISSHSDSMLPWAYALVLGICHAQVVDPDDDEHRVEFLWVRWLDSDNDTVPGPATRQLERLRLAPIEDSNSLAFIHPTTVIRGCHIIPAFHYGQELEASIQSAAHSAAGDYKYYYVNR